MLELGIVLLAVSATSQDIIQALNNTLNCVALL